MAQAIATGGRLIGAGDRPRWRWWWRPVLPLALLAIALQSGELADVVLGSMSDAFLQVTVFVAGTLALVYVLEKTFAVDVGKLLSQSRGWQPFFAALLGALPGCGGAIIVVTQYTRGYVTFGGVVSVLVATMGDAAFLLLAREPLTALGVMAVSIVAGTVSGTILDRVHGPDFMRAGPARASCPPFETGAPTGEAGGVLDMARKVWIAMVALGLVLGAGLAFQADIDLWFGALAAYEPSKWFGAAGAALALTMWATARIPNAHAMTCPFERSRLTTTQRVIADTNFVTTWVVVGFLAYELGVHAFGTGIEDWFRVWAPIVPLVAILVGFLPGCGPQIVVTSLYVTGVVPLSAQLGNAISNDGDALFPALALAPRAAVVATLYSAIPAFIIAYSYYFLFE